MAVSSAALSNGIGKICRIFSAVSSTPCLPFMSASTISGARKASGRNRLTSPPSMPGMSRSMLKS